MNQEAIKTLIRELEYPIMRGDAAAETIYRIGTDVADWPQMQNEVLELVGHMVSSLQEIDAIYSAAFEAMGGNSEKMTTSRMLAELKRQQGGRGADPAAADAIRKLMVPSQRSELAA